MEPCASSYRHVGQSCHLSDLNFNLFSCQFFGELESLSSPHCQRAEARHHFCHPSWQQTTRALCKAPTQLIIGAAVASQGHPALVANWRKAPATTIMECPKSLEGKASAHKPYQTILVKVRSYYSITNHKQTTCDASPKDGVRTTS